MTGSRTVDMSRVKRTLIEATGNGKDWSRRSLSLAAGLGPDGVRDIISGRSGNPKMETLTGLARALGKDVGIFFRDEEPGQVVAEFIDVIGEVAAGVWREQVEWPAGDRYQIAVNPSPVPGAPRFALILEGYSMDRLFGPGTVLDCIRIGGRGGIQAQEGDLVIVERCQHDLYEMTCKRLSRTAGGGFELLCESTRPEFQEPIPIGSPDMDSISDYIVRVIGIVVGNYTPQFRPREQRLLAR